MELNYSLALILIILIEAVIICKLYLEQKKLQKHFSRLFEDFVRLKRDMKGICAGTVGMGKRFADLELFTHQWVNKQEKSLPKGPESASYAHAGKLIEMGSSVDEVIASCGITRAEAELVAVLHRQKSGENY